MTGDSSLAGASERSRADARELILDRHFDRDSLHELRAAVQAHAAQAGLTEDLAGDVVLAVHELAANVVAHGAGRGRLRLSSGPGVLTCEIADDGPAARDHGAGAGGFDDLAGPGQPSPGQPSPGPAGPEAPAIPWPVEEGHGLWLVQQVAARLDLWSDDRGTRAVITFQVPGDR